MEPAEVEHASVHPLTDMIRSTAMTQRSALKFLRGPRTAFTMATIAFTGLALMGCSTGNDSDSGAKDDSIDITVLADISGKASFYGEAIKESAEFTADALNADGGIEGRTVNLTVKDTASAPGTASSLMNDAILGGADAVIFGVLSEEALTIAPLAQEANLAVINVQAAGDGIVETGDAIWRITPPQANFVPKYASYLADELDVTKASVFYSTDNAPSTKIATEVLPAAFEEVGVDVVNAVPSSSTETDLTTAVSKLLEGDPDFIHIQAVGAQNIGLITQLRRAGYEGGIGGGTAIGAGALSALEDDQADGVYYYSSFVGSDELPHETGRTFTTAFEDTVKSQPNTFHAETYDAFGFIAAAVKASGDASRAGVLAGLQMVADEGGFEGAQAGPITFTDRNAVTPGFVIEWRDGREMLAPGQ